MLKLEDLMELKKQTQGSPLPRSQGLAKYESNLTLTQRMVAALPTSLDL
jgi:hypothetical protein